MVKKKTATPTSSEPVSTFEFGGDTFSTYRLFGSDLVSKNTLPDNAISGLVARGSIPASLETWVPSEESLVTTDYTAPGWLCFNDITFRAGHRIPLSQRTVNVMNELGVLPCQLMPLVWRTLAAINAICEKHGVELTAEGIKYLYFVRAYKPGRFNFRSKDKLGTAVLSPDSKNDGSWWERFFFVRAESTGGPEWTRFTQATEGVLSRR